MNLFAKALLTVPKKEEIIEWVTSVKCYRNNNYTIDNVNKIVTVYKKVSSSGAIYHLDFMPITLDGYKPMKNIDNSQLSGFTSSAGVYYWRSFSNSNATDDNGEFVVREYSFNIVKEDTEEIVATYTLLIDWTKEAP